MATAQETGKALGMATGVLDTAGLGLGLGLGDGKAKASAAEAKAIEEADGFAQVFPEHKFESLTSCNSEATSLP